MRRPRHQATQLPQPRPLEGQPEVRCRLTGWHDAHGYGYVNCFEAVPAGSGWCPGVTFNEDVVAQEAQPA